MRIFLIFAFVCRYRYAKRLSSNFRTAYLRCMGMTVGRGTCLPRVWVSWPHQVSLGQDCQLEEGVRFKYDGPYRPGPSIVVHDRVFIGSGAEFNIMQSLEIGADSLVAAGARLIDHNHGFEPNTLIAAQPAVGSKIAIGRDCWIGANAVILKGVSVGDGSIVGAGAVVTASIPAGQIWGGVPARFIRARNMSATKKASNESPNGIAEIECCV